MIFDIEYTININIRSCVPFIRIQTCAQIHSYNTRARDLLRLPFMRTPKYQGSFRISGVRFIMAGPTLEINATR